MSLGPIRILVLEILLGLLIVEEMDAVGAS